MEDKEKAEFFDRLAKAARHRFDSRRTIEWQICFGIWTAFAVGSGLVVSSSDWKPGPVESFGATAVVLVLVIVFTLWAAKRHENDQQDMQTAYFWESALEKLLGLELPISLRPKEWLRVDTVANTLPGKTKNRSPLYQTVITSIFGVIFAGAFWSKAYSSSESSSRLSVETSQESRIAVERIEVGAQPTQRLSGTP
ncbi:MAG TPA: hypothetical protein VF590_11470 [Isosphaeraceae bacterium]